MNPYRLRRWMRRILLPLLAIGIGFLLVTIRFERAPAGSLLYSERIAEGALVILHRHPGQLRPGSVVLFATADGTACAEVDSVQIDEARNETVRFTGAAGMAYPDGVARDVVLGLILTSFGGTRSD